MKIYWFLFKINESLWNAYSQELPGADGRCQELIGTDWSDFWWAYCFVHACSFHFCCAHCFWLFQCTCYRWVHRFSLFTYLIFFWDMHWTLLKFSQILRMRGCRRVMPGCRCVMPACRRVMPGPCRVMLCCCRVIPGCHWCWDVIKF